MVCSLVSFLHTVDMMCFHVQIQRRNARYVAREVDASNRNFPRFVLSHVRDPSLEFELVILSQIVKPTGLLCNSFF